MTDSGEPTRGPTATAAARVTLAPPPGFRIDGVSDALTEPLRNRTVVRGDDVRATLFGGSLTVRFVVTDVTPAEPGTVTEETDIVVREDPVGPGDGVGEPSRTADEVGGLDDVLDSLRRLVAFPLERGDAYRSLAESAPAGVLLTGPRGSGKTLLADVVGAETAAHYVRIPHAEAVTRRYDDGFDGLAREAVREAPTVVLLDDVHRLAPADEDGPAGAGAARVGVFLDAVEREDVVVVGTTARPEELAPSLRRAGRFEHDLEVPVLDRDGRLDVLRTHTDGVRLAADVDLPGIADRTHGYVGADVRALIGAAVRHAVERAVDVSASEPGRGDWAGRQLSVTAVDFEEALETVTPSGMLGLRIERPDVSYDDIGGLDEAKLELVRAVEWPITYPELLDRVATTAPTGVLLHGLPGTGKTMLARAVANATDANFVAVEGPELLDRYVGESERAVREVFERAARNAPCVVFFDEIDALAPERGGSSDTEVTERVVSQLLTELDGITPREEVVVIGATNRPDIIDPALLRPGRLERIVEVPMPDEAAREEIFRTHAADVPTESVNFADLAGRTDGYSGSDVEAVVREAGLLAVEDHLRATVTQGQPVDPGSVAVRTEHFERALETVEPSVSATRRERYADLVDSLNAG
ncbi:MAG: AAA family ATPase [Halobellus sp.]